jgi:hypothetical protein
MEIHRKDKSSLSFPWREPVSVYDDGGPEGPVEFDLEGVRIRVSPTKMMAPDTGRTRFMVECLQCGDVVHGATTGPAQHCRWHIEDTHDK